MLESLRGVVAGTVAANEVVSTSITWLEVCTVPASAVLRYSPKLGNMTAAVEGGPVQHFFAIRQ